MDEKIEKNMPKMVTTDSDFWNSADEAHFSVAAGQVKPLPETTTIIIEDALKQGLLREASKEEIEKQEFYNSIDDAVKKRLIIPGKNYSETIKIYQKFVNSKKSVKPEINPKKEEISNVPKQ